jgi:hypothetical protein
MHDADTNTTYLLPPLEACKQRNHCLALASEFSQGRGILRDSSNIQCSSYTCLHSEANERHHSQATVLDLINGVLGRVQAHGVEGERVNEARLQGF